MFFPQLCFFVLTIILFILWHCKSPSQDSTSTCKWHEISLALLLSATKFCSKYRSVRRNIIVMQTIGLSKYCQKIAPNESSLIYMMSNFVCITFAQYCNNGLKVSYTDAEIILSLCLASSSIVVIMLLSKFPIFWHVYWVYVWQESLFLFLSKTQPVGWILLKHGLCFELTPLWRYNPWVMMSRRQ